MAKSPQNGGSGARVLSRAPAEILDGRLKRLGEGIGKVVYASEHWVVKRGRSSFEIAALIVLWKALKKLDHVLPGKVGRWLMERPSRKLRVLRVFVQATMAVVPKTIWYTSHVRQIWNQYQFRNARGERLAREFLDGTFLVPRRIEFPPTRVLVSGFPGSLVVSEATERVTCTLDECLRDLAKEERFDEVEMWLQRLLKLRQQGWRRGIFSTDPHLKNFGRIGDRVVLIDPGGLTNRWMDIEKRLDLEAVVSQPHVQLGLASILGARPDIAERFDAVYKATVNRDVIQELWPEPAGQPG